MSVIMGLAYLFGVAVVEGLVSVSLTGPVTSISIHGLVCLVRRDGVVGVAGLRGRHVGAEWRGLDGLDKVHDGGCVGIVGASRVVGLGGRRVRVVDGFGMP